MTQKRVFKPGMPFVPAQGDYFFLLFCFSSLRTEANVNKQPQNPYGLMFIYTIPLIFRMLIAIYVLFFYLYCSVYK